MTWSEFTSALTTIATTGQTITIDPNVVAALILGGYIMGSEGDDAGVTLTRIGQVWYQRTVIDRENDRILASYAGMFDRLFGK